MSVLELYEDEPNKAKGGGIAAHIVDVLTSNGTAGVSSFAPSALRVLGQSYILGVGVKAMGVTRSHLGITSSQVLIGTTSDQVYAMEKKLLDPRRPEKPTRVDKEEGLIPYSEYLPIQPTKFVTYSKQVLGLRRVDCFPTGRESSVLVLAFGMDVFASRVTPSKSFDMLEDDFSYALLVTTILGLLVATAVLSFMVRTDNLKRNWA